MIPRQFAIPSKRRHDFGTMPTACGWATCPELLEKGSTKTEDLTSRFKQATRTSDWFKCWGGGSRLSAHSHFWSRGIKCLKRSRTASSEHPNLNTQPRRPVCGFVFQRPAYLPKSTWGRRTTFCNMARLPPTPGYFRGRSELNGTILAMLLPRCIH